VERFEHPCAHDVRHRRAVRLLVDTAPRKKPAHTMSPSAGLRLRAEPLEHPIHVVLVEPEIPPNTGNIARLCAATASPLHLVGRLGFRIDEHAVRRAGLDYWHLVQVRQHLDLAHFRHALPDARWVLFSATSQKSYLDAQYRPGDALIFGKESVGLPAQLLEAHRESVFAIPTLGAVRSLNLANAVSIVVYEALRQLGALTNTHMR
jgi:tRNA (cytidine/uridine-2'-O-)-methyltransferase